MNILLSSSLPISACARSKNFIAEVRELKSPLVLYLKIFVLKKPPDASEAWRN